MAVDIEHFHAVAVQAVLHVGGEIPDALARKEVLLALDVELLALAFGILENRTDVVLVYARSSMASVTPSP